jgi:serine/threonine protein kinase
MESRFTLESAFSPDFADMTDPELVSLMKRFLSLNPANRPSALEALQHPFFFSDN